MPPPALLEQLARTYSLDLVVMFGSREHARGDSDTDIAVRGLRELSRDDELTLATELDKLYPNVDLCDLRKASPLVLGAVGQDALLLYQAKEGLFEELRLPPTKLCPFLPYLLHSIFIPCRPKDKTVS